MPPDTLLSLPKSQVKRQEVISGEYYPGPEAARRAAVLAEGIGGPTEGGWGTTAGDAVKARATVRARHSHCPPWGGSGAQGQGP